MGILEELFKAIGLQAQHAAGPKIVPLHGHDKTIIQKGETYEVVDLPPDHRRHVAHDLTAVVAFALRYDETQEECDAERAANPSVWYDRTQVTCLLDDSDRRDQIALTLRYTPQMSFFIGLDSGDLKGFEQFDLILKLRTLLKPCLSDDLFAASLRRLDWGVKTNVTGETAHGKASVGKSIRTEVSGAAAIPEYVTFRMPVWAAGYDATAEVECAIELDAQTCRVKLIPIPGCIEGELQRAEAELGGRLRADLGKDAAIYYGRP